MNEPCEAKKESPIERAMAQLNNAIGHTKETMTRFETILASVITNPEKPTADKPDTTASQTSLESRLNSMASEIKEINVYLGEVQNRVQL